VIMARKQTKANKCNSPSSISHNTSNASTVKSLDEIKSFEVEITELKSSKDILRTPSTQFAALSTITPEKNRKANRRLDIGIDPEGNLATTKETQSLTSFGLERIQCSASVKSIYKIIRKCTGSLGGNGNFGAIYGEATMGCMQRVVNLLKEHCEFDSSCSFIDVGSGLGKPNFHVAQDPGVRISLGVELEKIRHDLALHNLRHVLRYTRSSNSSIKHGNVFFQHGDITEARTFNPFTHVYMFDVGFPPPVLHQIATIFNSSQAPYLISYHSPKLMIEKYRFDVDFIAQFSTALHGSGESHTGYLYRHKGKDLPSFDHSKVDPIFQTGVSLLREESEKLVQYVEQANVALLSQSRVTRSRS